MYDPFGPDVMEDPFPAYAELRATCPVHRRTEAPPFVTLTRHTDVIDAVRDVATFSSRGGQGPLPSDVIALFDDPPSHTFFRRLVNKAFTPRSVQVRQPMIEELVDELVEAMARTPGRRADLHDALAMPLPMIVIARMLGVAEELGPTFKRWSDAQVAGLGDRNHDEQRRARREMNEYFLAEIARRRAALAAGEPLSDDLVSSLVAASQQEERPITDDELLSLLVQLLVGGNETTTSLVTNLVWRLLQDRSLWEAVVADRSLVEVAVEESLRFDPPVLGLFRTTACPVQVAGEELAAGEKVQLLWASANRDAAIWEDPDRFRLDRDVATLRSRHLSFGFGLHVCPGAPLSRLEARLALEALVRRLPDLRLDPDGSTERIEPFLLWGRRRLDVAW